MHFYQFLHPQFPKDAPSLAVGKTGFYSSGIKRRENDIKQY
jgi:hypothetical protein